MLYSISYYYDIQAELGLAGLVVFEMIMIAQEVSTAKPPTYVENGKITKMGVGSNQLLKRDEYEINYSSLLKMTSRVLRNKASCFSYG
jgi:hypothetical protein